MRDKTEKVLGQIEELVRDMTYSADEMYCRHADARYEYERISVEDDFLTGTDDDGEFLEREMDEAIEVITEYSDDFHSELALFDKQLAKLIQLRGKLAEETGIPMMSHLGTKGFGRASAEFVM
jgi:hypothetical protein